MSDTPIYDDIIEARRKADEARKKREKAERNKLTFSISGTRFDSWT